MTICIVLVIGIIIGLILSRFIFKPKVAGTLRVDMSDPTDNYLFVELSGDLRTTILEKNYVTFEVLVKNYISHN